MTHDPSVDKVSDPVDGPEEADGREKLFCSFIPRGMELPLVRGGHPLTGNPETTMYGFSSFR